MRSANALFAHENLIHKVQLRIEECLSMSMMSVCWKAHSDQNKMRRQVHLFLSLAIETKSNLYQINLWSSAAHAATPGNAALSKAAQPPSRRWGMNGGVLVAMFATSSGKELQLYRLHWRASGFGGNTRGKKHSFLGGGKFDGVATGRWMPLLFAFPAWLAPPFHGVLSKAL